MLKYLGAVLIIAIALADNVWGQGLGIGTGLDDLRMFPVASGPPPTCTINLLFDQTKTCSAVSFVMMGY